MLHGLGGSALGTFTAANGRNWVTDPEFLPSVVPDARIFTFGYNANVFDDVVTSRVVDHADGLLAGLLADRSGFEHRPILFVGHSLGGIVIKRALIRANTRSDYRASILQATKAIAFLGTPHSGSDLAASSWLYTVQKIVSWAHLRNTDRGSRITSELALFSNTVKDVSAEFVEIPTDNRIKMRSFAEQNKTRLLPPLKGDALVNSPDT